MDAGRLLDEPPDGGGQRAAREVPEQHERQFRRRFTPNVSPKVDANGGSKPRFTARCCSSMTRFAVFRRMKPVPMTKATA